MIQPRCCARAGPISGGSRLLLLRDEGLLRRARLLHGQQRRVRTRPHLNGPRPGVVYGQPRGPRGCCGLAARCRLGAASLLLLGASCGALAAPASTSTAAATSAIVATLAAAVFVAFEQALAPPEPEPAPSEPGPAYRGWAEVLVEAARAVVGEGCLFSRVIPQG